MYIKLKNVTSDYLLGYNRSVVLYADFNVVNYLYRRMLKLDKQITVYPDSTAIYWMLKLLYNNKSKMIVSTDLQEEILFKGVFLKKKFYFFGDSNEVLSKICKEMKRRFGCIKIAGMMNGYQYPENEICEIINSSGAEILFVGLGVTHQEQWIMNNFNNLNTPLIISVGGWFQFLAGNKVRAPLIMRKLHLEWLYKLFTDYKRVWKRYLINLPQFIIRVLRGKIKLELE